MERQDQAKRIRAARLYAGMSRLELAKHLEIHERTQVNSELGNREVKRPELAAIADATGVPMWFLEGGWDGWRSTGSDEGGGSSAGPEPTPHSPASTRDLGDLGDHRQAGGEG